MAFAATYNVVTNREDLADYLTIVSPRRTPIVSSLRKGPGPKAVYQEWPVDILQPADSSGVTEGADVTSFDNKAAQRARIGNMVQTTRKSWQVSNIEQYVQSAGVGNEAAFDVSKCLEELKRNMEAIVGGDQDMSSGNQNSGSPDHISRGLGCWIQSTAQSTNPVPTAYLPPAASINTTATASIGDSDIQGVLQSVYEQVGDTGNFNLYCGTNFKRGVTQLQRATGSSGTTKTYQVIEEATTHEINLNVETYVGDFGTIDLIPDLFLGASSTPGPNFANTSGTRARAYLIDPEMASINYLMAPFSMELPDLGGGRRGYVECSFTLCVKNPLAFGKFAATS